MNKQRRRFIVSSLLALIAITITYLIATRGLSSLLWRGPFAPRLLPYSETSYQATRDRAAALIAALESHKQSTGEYPQALEELAPVATQSLDSPLVGDGKWRYKRLAPDRFTLGFLVGPTYENDLYASENAKWHVDR